MAWRWAFGAAAWMLVLLALWIWLDSLPVSRADQFLLGSGAPALIGRAITHIFAGTTARLLRAFAVLLPGFVLLWTVSAATGRAAILRTLVPESPLSWRTLLAVSFLRAMIAVAATIGIVAACIAFVRVSAPAPPAEGRPDAALALFFTLIFTVFICWSVVNWFLAIAPIYAIRSRGLGQTLSATLANFRENTGKWFWVGGMFGFIHLGLFVVFSGIATMPLGVASVVPRLFTLLAIAVITLAYFALADAVHVLRFVAYLAMAETDHTSVGISAVLETSGPVAANPLAVHR
jgi:hypothetical protein